MGFRITTNMMMNTYRYNLMNSTNTLSDSMDRVQTKRNFNSYAEDPASASEAFRLRRDWWQSHNQIDNNTATYSKFHTAWTNLGGIITNLSDANGRMSAIRGNTGTSGESRSALAQVLRQTADSVVHAMNQKVGEQFIFAGNDGLNVPFSWSDDGKTLFYRGIDVNAGSVEKPTAAEPGWMAAVLANNPGGLTDNQQAWYDYYTHETNVKPDVTVNPEPGWLDPTAADTVLNAAPAAGSADEGWIDYYKHQVEDPPTADEPSWITNAKEEDFDEFGVPKNMPDSSTDEIEQGWIDYYKDQSDFKKLQKMEGEHLYVDLGMGLKEDDNDKLINGSAFDTSLPGIKFIDYGMDENGDPNNLALVMKKLADVFETWNEDIDPQGYDPSLASDPELKKMTSKELEQVAFRLMDKLNEAQEHTTEMYTELNARSSFLTTNGDRLEDQAINLNEQIINLEQPNLADAIKDLSYNQMCYNAALKIGTQLLSQSLIDYMN